MATPPRPIRPSRRVATPRVERPDIPEDVQVRLPGDVRRDVKANAPNAEVADDVLRALTIAGELVAEDRADEAMPLLRWSKQAVGRSAFVRELLGLAHYHQGQWHEAVAELRTYARLLARADQHHVIADCLRGLGRPPSDVADAVRELLEDRRAPADRRVEGLLVWAGALADADELSAARGVLRRADRDLLDEAGEEARLRWTYVVADLAERAGDVEHAVAAFRKVAAMPGDPYGAGERLDALEG